MNEALQLDHELLAKVAGGDTAALAELVRRHQGRVHSLAVRMLGCYHEAEDVCQEAFLRVYRAAGSFSPDARFTTWLYRIVMNLCYDVLRRKKCSEVPQDVEAPDWSDPQRSAQSNELGIRVRQAVQALPERQRAAVILHRYQHLSHEQIAQVMQCSASAVESLLVRAYQELRKGFQEFAPENRREDAPANVSQARSEHATPDTATAARASRRRCLCPIRRGSQDPSCRLSGLPATGG